MSRQLLLSCCLGILATVTLVTLPAHPQVIPDQNHYKIYEVIAPVPPSPVTGPITLSDQFGTSVISELTLEKFGIPVEKHLLDATGEVFPIIDPTLHYTWWEFQNTELVRRADVLDQFGGYSWRLRDSGYLLTPAGKNQATVPDGNHYKCYFADDAPVINITVGLVDQVDSVAVVVLAGELFCNPVEKTFQGATYPIVDQEAHLTCYRVNNPKSYNVVELATDQFGERDITLGQNVYLCLPAEKGNVVGSEPATWGRIKALYN